ncbi:MAG: NAD(P)H-hydrate dehydratase [Bradyrhizobium sp.]|nr:MAG: NAD(P)H-hydrate dehydratase [Bradyrhizobium sp.]
MLDPRRFPELLTPAEMAEADRLSVAAGVSSAAMMERAGAAVAAEAARMAPSRGRIAVLCGQGGNGGDGFVAARLLVEWGYRVELSLMGDHATLLAARDGLRGDAAVAAGRWSGPVRNAGSLDLDAADLVIDALLGAGLSRPLAGEALAEVGRINAFGRSGRPVLSIDVPSGLDGESGVAQGAAVNASASVTFFRLKPGHLLQPGRALCGRLVLAEIGSAPSALAAIAPSAFVNAPAIWRSELSRPGAGSHKYSRGAALIVSGAAHRTGAARLAARAALRVGAGLATIASPLAAVADNAAHSTAVMVAPFSGLAGFARLLADPRRNAALIGPGAGVGEETRGLVAAALSAPSDKPRAIILDADALTSFAGDAAGLAKLIAGAAHATVVTPHEGEFARLFRGCTEIIENKSKLSRARAAAAMLGAFVVLKGADTVVAAPDGRAAIGFDLPPELATAGSGDTLAGFVCGLLAQSMPGFEAAAAAVWLHGACARALGPGLIAEDLAEALPGVLRALLA